MTPQPDQQCLPAQALGVSKQAVSKAANSPIWTDPRW